MANIAKQDKQTQMYSLVEKWQNSSSSKKEICLEHKVKVCTFNYWLKKYLKNKSSEFIELKPESNYSDLESNTVVRFKFSGNISAEVPAELAIRFMHQLIAD